MGIKIFALITSQTSSDDEQAPRERWLRLSPWLSPSLVRGARSQHPSWGSKALMCTARRCRQRREEPDGMPKLVSGRGRLPGATGAMGGTRAPSLPCLHTAGDLEFNNLMRAVQLQASFAFACACACPWLGGYRVGGPGARWR